MKNIPDAIFEHIFPAMLQAPSSSKVHFDEKTHAALERLIAVALNGTGQSSHVADLLLAWWSASENGGFDPMSFRCIDDTLVTDCLQLLAWIGRNNCHPDSAGYGDEFKMIWRMWRSEKPIA